jgi:putative peptidoglycan lipid II flippase
MGLGRTVGLVREIVVAALFGVSGQMDAWVVAFTLVGVPSAIVMNALQTALIPPFCRTSGAEEKKALLAAAVTVTLLAMGAGAVILLSAGEWLLGLIHSGAGASAAEQSARLLWLLIPYYFFSAVNLLGYGVLQAEKQFFKNAAIPVCAPLTVIVVLVLWPEKVNVSTLASAISTGAFVEFAMLTLTLRRLGLNLMRVGSPMTLLGDIGVALQAMWLMPGMIIMSAMPVIEQTIAAGLGEGANAALAYGQRIPAAINGLAAGALGMAVLPFFSAAIGRDGPDVLSDVLARYVRPLGMAASVVAILLALASLWIVQLLYERGAFDSHATAVVAAVQAAYFLQLPGMIVGMLYTRAAVAQGRARMLTILAVATVMTQVALAWTFSFWLGLAGIGFAAAAVSTLNAAVLVKLVSGRVPGVHQDLRRAE